MTQYQGYRTEQNSEAIRADIERTRSSMGNKIDRIQERVNPEHLKGQAQDVMRTAVHEGTDAVVGYVRDHASDFGSALVDVIKRNPVPAALIGVGAGWLLYESLSGHSKHNGHHYRRRSPANYQVGGYEYDDQYRGSRFSAQYGYSQSGYAPSSFTAQSTSGQEQEGGGVASQIRHQAEHVADTIGDKVEQVRHQAEHLAEAVGDKVDQVTGKAQELGRQTRYQTQQVGSQAQQLGQQARHQVQQAGSQAQHLVEANPLGLGLAAFAIGTAIGLALPATRRESQVMGPWRDQVMEKAQTMAGDVKQRVQEVVEEVKPELQQVASKVVDDVKQTSKEAVTEVKDVVKKAGETAKEPKDKNAEATSGWSEQANKEQKPGQSSTY